MKEEPLYVPFIDGFDSGREILFMQEAKEDGEATFVSSGGGL